MLIEGSSALLEEWTGHLRARWAGHRAAAAEAGGHQGLWLDGDAAQAIACDAAITPVVVGDVNPDAFDDLIRLCVQLGKLRHGTPPDTGTGDGAGGGAPEVPAAFGGTRSREALEQAVIGKAVELLSGPGGLASFLRRKLLGARLGGDSLPLDKGQDQGPPQPRTTSTSRVTPGRTTRTAPDEHGPRGGGFGAHPVLSCVWVT